MKKSWILFIICLVINMATEIAIDLGTSKTVIASGNKILLELPSAVTVDSETWEPIYFGEKAYQTYGRTPDSLTTVFPIQHGIIAALDAAEAMLSEYVRSVFGNRISRPKIMVSMPTGVTPIQHHTVANAIETAGGRNVNVIESPIAAAIGMNIDFSKPHGSMIVDFGAGCTDIATISMGGIVECESYKTASRDIDELIMRYVKKEHNILIGPLTAETIKKQLGSAYERPLQVTMTAKGRNLLTGLPQSFEITSSEVYSATYEALFSICNEVRAVLERTPPDIVGDIKESGIHLTGGGALINGFDKLLSEFIGTDVFLADDPTHTVVKGEAIAIKRPELLENGDYLYRSIKELIVEQ